MVQKIEKIYAAWERFFQLIGNHADIGRFETIFDITQDCIVTDLNENERNLTELRAKNDKELTDTYKRLRDLQHQNFESIATKQLTIEREHVGLISLEKEPPTLSKVRSN